MCAASSTPLAPPPMMRTRVIDVGGLRQGIRTQRLEGGNAEPKRQPWQAPVVSDYATVSGTQSNKFSYAARAACAATSDVIMPINP